MKQSRRFGPAHAIISLFLHIRLCLVFQLGIGGGEKEQSPLGEYTSEVVKPDPPVIKATYPSKYFCQLDEHSVVLNFM